MLFVGIDVAKSKYDCCIIDSDGVLYTDSLRISIGEIERFPTPAKLLAFTGMEPSTYQSGKFTASKTPMVKRGSTYLR